MAHQDPQAAEALRAGLRRFAKALPQSVPWREEQEQFGCSFTFEPPVSPPLEVAGGTGWFSLFYGSAGFEAHLPDVETAAWVVQLCESAAAGRVTERRIWRPLIGKIITVFAIHGERGIEEVAHTDFAVTIWPWRGPAITTYPPWR